MAGQMNYFGLLLKLKERLEKVCWLVVVSSHW